MRQRVGSDVTAAAQHALQHIGADLDAAGRRVFGRLVDVGGPEPLARYERWRRFDNLTLITVTDLLTRLFSNDFGPLKLARDLGMAAVNRMPPLKKFFMRHAMGMVGDLPRMIRGEPL